MFKKIKLTKENITWGLTAFLVVAAGILLYFLLDNLESIGNFLSTLSAALAPFLWGFVLAFFAGPLMKKLEQKLPKWLAVTICILVIILVMIALVMLVVPQTVECIKMIAQQSPELIEEGADKLKEIFQNSPQLVEQMEELEINFTTAMGKILPSIGNFLTKFSSGVYSAFSGIFNLIIGIIVACYILYNLDMARAGGTKIIYSLFPIEKAERILSSMDFVAQTFRSYVDGKLLDSLFVGIVVYIFCLISKMPYSLLISVLVAVTNIIPFFGPFLGAIPSALLILMVDPTKCLIFVIFILVLQQIEGNIIEPAIVGKSVGMNGFWVLLATLVGGALFGVAGMILGIPLFYCIYVAISYAIDKRLEKKNLPVETEDYINIDHIDRETREPVYEEQTEESGTTPEGGAG